MSERRFAGCLRHAQPALTSMDFVGQSAALSLHTLVVDMNQQR
jgi:hypothetical protein